MPVGFWKVVAANMVRSDRSLSGTHLLCAVGRYQEACSQVKSFHLIQFLSPGIYCMIHNSVSFYSCVIHQWLNYKYYLHLHTCSCYYNETICTFLCTWTYLSFALPNGSRWTLMSVSCDIVGQSSHERLNTCVSCSRLLDTKLRNDAN